MKFRCNIPIMIIWQTLCLKLTLDSYYLHPFHFKEMALFCVQGRALCFQKRKRKGYDITFKTFCCLCSMHLIPSANWYCDRPYLLVS